MVQEVSFEKKKQCSPRVLAALRHKPRRGSGASYSRGRTSRAPLRRAWRRRTAAQRPSSREGEAALCRGPSLTARRALSLVTSLLHNLPPPPRPSSPPPSTSLTTSSCLCSLPRDLAPCRMTPVHDSAYNSPRIAKDAAEDGFAEVFSEHSTGMHLRRRVRPTATTPPCTRTCAHHTLTSRP